MLRLLLQGHGLPEVEMFYSTPIRVLWPLLVFLGYLIPFRDLMGGPSLGCSRQQSSCQVVPQFGPLLVSAMDQG